MLSKWIKSFITPSNEDESESGDDKINSEFKHASTEDLREDIYNRYRLYASVYNNAKVFDIDKFNQRYTAMLRLGKMEPKIFLITEIEALNVFVKRLEEKQKVEEQEKKKESALEALYNQYRERLIKYRRVALHKNALEEIERLYGCLFDFSDKHLKSLLKMHAHLSKPHEKDMFRKLELYFNDLLPGNVKKYPADFQHYINKVNYIQNVNKEEIDKIGQEVLRRVFFFMRDLIKVLNFFKSDGDIKFNTLKFVVHNKTFQYTDYDDILRTDIDTILKDFRLVGLF